MPKLVVYAYGNVPGRSTEMLLQFMQFHTFMVNDRLLVVSGFNGEDRGVDLNVVRRSIKDQILQRANQSGVGIAFEGPRANAELLMVNYHNIERIYALVYGSINALLSRFPLDTRMGCTGDGHSQVILAVTQACGQFPETTVWFSHGTQYRTLTQVVHDIPSEAPPADLPRAMMYDYKLSLNVFHDMHQFIEQMNMLLNTHEYDAARIIVRAKYNAVRLTGIVNTIRRQWFALIDSLHYWHNFSHALALQQVEMLIQVSAIPINAHDAQILRTIRSRLQILRTQYNSLEEIAQYKLAGDGANLAAHIENYNHWLTANHCHGYELAIDKYHNALRCMEQGRYDDAGVRLNSVLELLVVVRLLLNYNIVTTNMRELEQAGLLGRTTPQYDGVVNTSRRDLYRMLLNQNNKDPLWLMYFELGGNAPSYQNTLLETAIRKRHKSYLVHGNSVISQFDCAEFAGFVLRLIEAVVGPGVDIDSYAIPKFQLDMHFDDDGQIVPIGWRVQ